MKKKVIAVAVVVLIMIVMIVSSAKNNSNVVEATATQSNAIAPAVNAEADKYEEYFEAENVIDYEEYFETENILEYKLEDWFYRNEVVERLEKKEPFSSDEKSIYRKLGYKCFDDYSVKKFKEFRYYPVLVHVEDSLVMYYTDRWGGISKETVLGISTAFGGSTGRNLHLEVTEKAIHETKNHIVEYDTDTGYMTVYQFNEEIRKDFIGKNAVYTGKSETQGYIFRLGTDVYAVRYDCVTIDAGVWVIAHNVKEVILADYYHSSYAFSQPLFLMTDGTLKVYGGPSGERPDDEKNLLNVHYEGGYDRYR